MVRTSISPWTAVLGKRSLAAIPTFFRGSPSILNSIATFSARADNQYQVTNEGTKLQFGQVRDRLQLFIQGKAPDGMDINRYYNFDWTDPGAAPDDKTVLAQCAVLQKELENLVKAPLVEPFAGPALLTGRAAAVFFHEVFGHRDEGFRQKDISEGQTFTTKVGEQIMPSFISIVDDPTMMRLGSNVLLGYYPYDDEGVASQRITLVDKGVLRGFEMSRQPIVGFPQSNGHGRRQVGLPPVSRQGNLIVQSSKQVSFDELRKMLIAEVTRQGKPFGLLIDDIAGGFTFTGRSQPQAFQVQPAGGVQDISRRAAGRTHSRRGYRGHSPGVAGQYPGHRKQDRNLQRLLRRRIGLRPGRRRRACHASFRTGSREEGNLHGSSARFSRRRHMTPVGSGLAG